MDKRTIKFLKNYIKSHVYGRYADYTLQSLFRAYENREINTFDDVLIATQAFLTFLHINKKRILKKMKDIYKEDFDNELECLIRTFDIFSDPHILNSQVKFVKIANVLYSPQNSKILDVGPGAFPITSYLFTDIYDDVHAMDKFLLSDDFLKSQNITPHSEFFTQLTDVSDYDYIVGKRPCSAIENIVTNSAKANKPYLIELCGCELDKYVLPDGTHPHTWEDILREIDPNISFVQDYAFNIDATQSQFLRLLEENNPIFEKEKITQNGLTFPALSFLADCFNEIELELYTQMI